jgi:hypothetical protein
MPRMVLFNIQMCFVLPGGHAQAIRCIEYWDAARLKKYGVAQVNMNTVVTEK